MARGKRIVSFRRAPLRRLQYYFKSWILERIVNFSTSSDQENLQQDDYMESNDNSDPIVIPAERTALITLTGTFSAFSNAVLGMCHVGLYNVTKGEYWNPAVFLVGAGISNVADTPITTVSYTVRVTTATQFMLRCPLAVGSFTLDAGLSVVVEYL